MIKQDYDRIFRTKNGVYMLTMIDEKNGIVYYYQQGYTKYGVITTSLKNWNRNIELGYFKEMF